MRCSHLSVLGPTSLTKCALPLLPPRTSLLPPSPVRASASFSPHASLLLFCSIIYHFSVCPIHTPQERACWAISHPLVAGKEPTEAAGFLGCCPDYKWLLLVTCPSSCLSDVSLPQKPLGNGHRFSKCFLHHMSGRSVS